MNYCAQRHSEIGQEVGKHRVKRREVESIKWAMERR